MPEEGQVLAGILSLVTVGTAGFTWSASSGDAPASPRSRRSSPAPGSSLVLALLCQLHADLAGQTGTRDWLSRSGVAVAAILMPAGFFLSSMVAGRTKPSARIVFAGAVVLGAGPTSLGLLNTSGSGNP